MEAKKYRYCGPVRLYDDIVIDKWLAETMAVSEKKARSNLAYQARKRLHIVSGPIKLTGQLVCLGY